MGYSRVLLKDREDSGVMATNENSILSKLTKIPILGSY